MFRHTAALTLVLLTPSLIQAQTRSDTTRVRDSVRLTEIVTRASREPLAARLRATVADVLAPTERADRQIRLLADALRLLTGGSVGGTGGTGGTASLFLRGVNSNQTLFMVDGIRINDANTDLGATLGGLELSPDDMVEIARGPQSTSFGGAAIGGVVAIGSARPSTGLVIDGSAHGGRFSTYHGTAAASYGSERLDLAASATFVDTENERPHNDYDQRTEHVHLEYRPSSRWQVGASIRGQQYHLVSPGDIRTANVTPVGTTRFDQTIATGFVHASLTERWTSRLTLGGQTYWLSGTSQYNGGDAYVSRLTVDRRVVDWQHRLELGSAIVVLAGANAEWSTVADNDGSRDERLVAGFGEVIAAPTADLTLSVGLRHDDYTSFTGRTTGRIGASYYLPTPGLKFRATYGSGFLPPSLAARYGSPFQKANPSIRPEQSRGWDAGVDWFFARASGVLGITIFENRITDLIGYQGAPYPELGQSVNIGQARTRGAELTSRFAAGGFDLRLGYHYLQAIDLTASEADLERLIRRPKHSVSGDLHWSGSRLDVGAGAVAALDREDTDFNVFPFRRVDPGNYLDGRVYAGWRARRGVALQAAIDNVGNTRYESAYGFPALGRRATLGIALGTGR